MSEDKISTSLRDLIKQYDTSFLKVIHERLGIVLHRHQITDLHTTLGKACLKFKCTPEEYLKKISTESFDSSYLEFLISGVTIGETYFFRDKNQIKLLQEKLLPALIRNKQQSGQRSIRIWSAASATGEEIYTIAMMLSEMISSAEKWSLHLIGTDINVRSLQKAMTGHYSQWSMRSIPDYFLKKYFIKLGNQYQLSDEIKKLVRFSYYNLNDANYPAIFNDTNAMDLIICCNVFIYFDNAHIETLMQKFNSNLIPGGYLLLGASDPILLTNTNLVFHNDTGIYFTKPLPGDTAVASVPPSIINKPVIPVKTPVKPILRKVTASLTPPKVVETAHSRINHPISQLLSESKWQEALDLINSCQESSVFLLNAKATVLANLGKLDAAEICCQQALAIEGTNKHTYFTYSLVLAELNRFKEAEDLLRKTLFLDPEFVEGYFQLGLLLLRSKRTEQGLKCLTNALAIAKSKNPENEASELNGLKYKQLVDILEQEISLHKELEA